MTDIYNGPIIVIPMSDFRRWTNDDQSERRDADQFVLFAFKNVDPLPLAERAAADRIHPVRGFVTDFASIPAPVKWFIKPIGRYSRAALYHDWGYYERPHGVARRTVDRAFRETMLADGVSKWKAYTMWGFVKVFGGPAYKASWKPNSQAAGKVKEIDPAVMDHIAKEVAA